jgi:hypothetical protein
MNFTLPLSAEERKRLRVLAAEDGVSSAEYVRRRLFGGVDGVLTPVEGEGGSIGCSGADGLPSPPSRPEPVGWDQVGAKPWKDVRGAAARLEEGIDEPVTSVPSPKSASYRALVREHRHSSSSFTSTGLPVCVCGLRHVAGQWVAVNEEER